MVIKQCLENSGRPKAIDPWAIDPWAIKHSASKNNNTFSDHILPHSVPEPSSGIHFIQLSGVPHD